MPTHLPQHVTPDDIRASFGRCSTVLEVQQDLRMSRESLRSLTARHGIERPDYWHSSPKQLLDAIAKAEAEPETEAL